MPGKVRLDPLARGEIPFKFEPNICKLGRVKLRKIRRRWGNVVCLTWEGLNPMKKKYNELGCMMFNPIILKMIWLGYS